VNAKQISSARRAANSGLQKKENCQIRLDRLIVGIPSALPDGLPEPRGFRRIADHLVRRKGKIATYDRVQKFVSERNACKVSIKHKRLVPWVPWCRIEMVADDRTGLTLEEINAFWPNARITEFRFWNLPSIFIPTLWSMNRSCVLRPDSGNRRSIESEAGETIWFMAVGAVLNLFAAIRRAKSAGIVWNSNFTARFCGRKG
jgi:hypothetical protein